MSDSTERCWLVERTFNERNIVTIIYATPDGSQYHQRERSANALQSGSAVTAAADIDEDELEAVEDAETRERYASEVERTAEAYDADEAI